MGCKNFYKKGSFTLLQQAQHMPYLQKILIIIFMSMQFYRYYRLQTLINSKRQQNMGNQVCQECKTVNSNIAPITNISDIHDPDAPDLSYAFEDTIKYQIPCAVNHKFTDLIPTHVPEDFKRGRKFTDAFFLVPYSVYYIGEWEKGRPQGLGEIVFKSGSVLYGTFNQGKVQGQDCIFIMESGSYYRGNMKDNTFSGKGIFVEPNGHTYEGQWKDNTPHGQGKEKFANGDQFIGTYVEGKKSGPDCMYIWNNHPQIKEYNGSFNNFIEGKGVLTKKDGTTIEGIFDSTENITDAIMKNSSYQYRGNLKNGKMDGFGRISFLRENEQYQGDFFNGEIHGHGTFTDSKRVKKTGNWVMGKLIRKSQGITSDDITKLVLLIDQEFSANNYVEDAIQEINNRLSVVVKNAKAEVIDEYRANKISGNKFLLVQVGQIFVLVSSNI